jgi:hypothetical protein
MYLLLILFIICNYHPYVFGNNIVLIEGVSENRGGTIASLQEFSIAWNSHDLDKLLSFMSDDHCEFHAVAGPELLGKSFIGKDQVN